MDLTPETCLLSWKPPLDDGGSPITNYIIEKYEISSGVCIFNTYYNITHIYVELIKPFF
jgi:hypothetical protein